MRGLVIDAGDTEATRQVARNIYDGILFEKDICRLTSLPDDLRAYDVVFVGFDMKSNSISETVRTFLGSLDDVQVALFATVDGPAVGITTRAALRRNRECLGRSARFMGGFICSSGPDCDNIVHSTVGDLLGAIDFARDIGFSLRS
ncbi:flavodoxin family protein [uncultured Megasphaera sp.]|uniref:flavodoxin family protein n=1 Tax=uncultured Megasphaera sp. TaxID=165188 RepID=UPI0025D544C5|nr:flavodoxin family protein [uncultured Megasphaera sp.]